MCDAVVVPSRPAKVTSTSIVLRTSSIKTTASPVPGDAFGGDSAGPLRGVANISTAACATGACTAAAAISPNPKAIHLMMSIPPLTCCRKSAIENQLNQLGVASSPEIGDKLPEPRRVRAGLDDTIPAGYAYRMSLFPPLLDHV